MELYWDRPREHWPRVSDGSIAIFTHLLDLDALLTEAAKIVRVVTAHEYDDKNFDTCVQNSLSQCRPEVRAGAHEKIFQK